MGWNAYFSNFAGCMLVLWHWGWRCFRNENKELKKLNLRRLRCIVVDPLCSSCVKLLRDWANVGRAAQADGAGEKWRYVLGDGHQRAGLRALVLRRHRNHDVVLVPHVEGIWVGVGEGCRHVVRADSLHLSLFCQLLFNRSQQTVCGWTKKEGWEQSDWFLLSYNICLKQLHNCKRKNELRQVQAEETPGQNVKKN